MIDAFHKVYVIDGEHAAWENACETVMNDHPDVFVSLQSDREDRWKYNRLIREIFAKHDLVDTIIDFGVTFEDDIHAITNPINKHCSKIL